MADDGHSDDGAPIRVVSVKIVKCSLWLTTFQSDDGALIRVVSVNIVTCSLWLTTVQSDDGAPIRVVSVKIVMCSLSLTGSKRSTAFPFGSSQVKLSPVVFTNRRKSSFVSGTLISGHPAGVYVVLSPTCEDWCGARSALSRLFQCKPV